MRRFERVVILAALLGIGRVDPCSAASLYALVDTGEVFSSEDQGVSWSLKSTLSIHDASALVAGSAPEDLFLATESGTIYRSSDAGVTWMGVGIVPAGDVVDLAAHLDGTFLALTRTGVVWASSDDGASFTLQGTLTGSNHVSLVRDVASVFYALTETGEVAASLDVGVTWSVVGAIPVPDAVAILPVDGLVVLADTGLTWRSVDQGVTWEAVGTVSQVGMSDLALHVGRLVAVSREGLVAESMDGASWNVVGTVNQVSVRVLADDTPQTIGVPQSVPDIPWVRLAPPFPNPLPSTRVLQVGFTLARDDLVTLELFDVQGRRVAHRERGRFTAASKHRVAWPIPELRSGVYFLMLRTERGLQTGHRFAVVR